MKSYDIYVFCQNCLVEHPMGIKVDLAKGPSSKQSIGSYYPQESIPPRISKLIDQPVLCPKTGKTFVQNDINQIFITPLPSIGKNL